MWDCTPVMEVKVYIQYRLPMKSTKVLNPRHNGIQGPGCCTQALPGLLTGPRERVNVILHIHIQ